MGDGQPERFPWTQAGALVETWAGEVSINPPGPNVYACGLCGALVAFESVAAGREDHERFHADLERLAAR